MTQQNTTPPALDALIQRRIRQDVQSMHAYAIQDSAGMVKLDVDPGGGLRIDENFYPHGEQFRGRRIHQIRLQGGDASTDSYCYR